jgi:hypothetical protein
VKTKTNENLGIDVEVTAVAKPIFATVMLDCCTSMSN